MGIKLDLGIQMSLSENIERPLELNQNMFCEYGLSKKCNSGMTENISLENSGNKKGDYEKENICL